MPEPLSPKSGFGMNVAVLPCLRATFLTMYLNHMQLVGHRDAASVELHVDLALTGGGDLVVADLDLDARRLQREHHLRAEVRERVGRRDGEVALLVARLVAEVRALLAARVPRALVGVDVVEARSFGFE